MTNIPASLSNEKGLTELFSTFGVVESVTLREEAARPYAFVNFKTNEAAKKAILEGKNLKLPEGGKLEVYPHHTKKELNRITSNQTTERVQPQTKDRYEDSNLFIRPIPGEITEEEIRKQFSVFGDIQSVLLLNMKG